MKDKNWSVTAQRMRKRLDALHMTQRELAEKTGKTEATISRWAKGDRIPLATEYVGLSKALQCTCDYLLGLSSNPNLTSKQEKGETKQCTEI